MVAGLSAMAEDLVPKVDKGKQARILITTDLEVDDMNGVILSLLYSDQYDLAGIVWTAGMFHFSGDGGVHKLGEVTPHYRCNATHVEHSVKNPGELGSYRPADPTWLPRILDCYEEDYKSLSKNNPNYPTPAYIRSITKVGNIEFEGDYREETEGSKFIEQCIMDDDPRPLYIQHWGGINTTVRALYSIYEKYHGTPQWNDVLAKVTKKVRIGGDGEDNCRKDSKIDEMFPGLQNGGYSMGSFFTYGSFFYASYDAKMMRAPEELQKYLHADWTLPNFKRGHGRMLSEMWLMAEGRAVFGEPLIYNYGLIDYMDWAGSAKLGWGPENLVNFPKAHFKPYDWMCCQFGCAQFINIGLRPDVNNRGVNHYSAVMWEELAARAEWAVKTPAECNHAPVVTAEQKDLTVKKGKTVTLKGAATDPDGNELSSKWYVAPTACIYKMPKAEPKTNSGASFVGVSFGAAPATSKAAEALTVSAATGWTTTFTVPKDAKKGDRFVINLEVKDNAAKPMTRFQQYVITVK